MRKILSVVFVLSVLLVSGQDKHSVEDYIFDRFVDSTGWEVVKIMVPGKPPDHHREPIAIPTRSTVSLSNVPGYYGRERCGSGNVWR